MLHHLFVAGCSPRPDLEPEIEILMQMICKGTIFKWKLQWNGGGRTREEIQQRYVSNYNPTGAWSHREFLSMNATTVLSISHLSLGLRRLPKLNLTSLESPGKTAFHSAGLEKQVYINFKEPILCFFSLICTQWLKVDNLKSTVVGMFILQKSVHAVHQDLCLSIRRAGW